MNWLRQLVDTFGWALPVVAGGGIVVGFAVGLCVGIMIGVAL